MTTIQAEIIVSESVTRKQLTSKIHNNLDDYFRLITSQSGNLLASITNMKQLVMYDIESQSLINNFTEENVTHCKFNQNESMIAITTRTPSIKIFQITEAKDSSTKSVNQLQQIRPSVLNTTYGWIVSTFDNTNFVYTQNEQIYALNTETYEQNIISVDPLIRTKCAPYYLIMDRELKHLVSSSKTGQICKYNITIKQSSLPESKNNQFFPQISLLQSATLSSTTPLTISDMNQSRSFILVSTSMVTQNQQSYYNTFVISKSNINIFSKIKLQQQLIAPPITILSDNVENYLLAFLKGQQSLYIFDLGELQRQNKLVDYELIQSDDSQYTDVKTLNYISKQRMPFLMHAINYNGISQTLMMGIQSTKNEDKIIYVDFNFNCTNMVDQYRQIQNISITSNGSIKPMCTEQCKEIKAGSAFSFPRGECVIMTVSQISDENQCTSLGGGYEWNTLGEYCQLQCMKIANSLSEVSLGQPGECYCQDEYAWDNKTSKCLSISAASSTVITPVVQPNSTKNNTDKNNTQPSNLPEQSSKVGLAVGISLGVVVLIIGVIIFLYLYKTKRLCFKRPSSSSQIQQNQLKQTASAKSSNSDELKSNSNKSQQINSQNHQKQQIEVDNDQINVDSQRNF